MSEKPLRLWILGCAAGCSLAGFGAGAVLPGLIDAAALADADDDADAVYRRRLTDDFRLSGRQQHELRIVMQRFKQEELQVYRGAKFDQLPESLQSELMAARRRYADRIQALLTPEQQRQFEAQGGAAGKAR